MIISNELLFQPEHMVFFNFLIGVKCVFCIQEIRMGVLKALEYATRKIIC